MFRTPDRRFAATLPVSLLLGLLFGTMTAQQAVAQGSANYTLVLEVRAKTTSQCKCDSPNATDCAFNTTAGYRNTSQGASTDGWRISFTSYYRNVLNYNDTMVDGGQLYANGSISNGSHGLTITKNGASNSIVCGLVQYYNYYDVDWSSPLTFVDNGRTYEFVDTEWYVHNSTNHTVDLKKKPLSEDCASITICTCIACLGTFDLSQSGSTGNPIVIAQ